MGGHSQVYRSTATRRVVAAIQSLLPPSPAAPGPQVHVAHSLTFSSQGLQRSGGASPQGESEPKGEKEAPRGPDSAQCFLPVGCSERITQQGENGG